MPKKIHVFSRGKKDFIEELSDEPKVSVIPMKD
jgi:hypothetical protein